MGRGKGLSCGVCKRYLVIRWGAWGDILYALPTIEALRKECDYLHFETGSRGEILLRHHPAFSRITTYDVSQCPSEKWTDVALGRWKDLEESESWGKAVNFYHCIEVDGIAEEWQQEFFYPRERRRNIYGSRNFYEAHFERAGIPIPDPFDCVTVYFPDDVMEWREEWERRHSGKFVVAIALNGSTAQKFPQYWKALVEEISGSFQDVSFVLLGDGAGEALRFTLSRGNVLFTAGTWPYMQSLMMMQMADYAIGPETGLMVGAGLFGTPKSMICTSCSPYQATKYHKNDFSLQAAASCSPCHRAIYNPKWCNGREHEWGWMPECNHGCNFNRILEGVEFAKNVRGLRRQVDRCEGPGFGSLPDLRALHDLQTDRSEEIRSGILREVQPL